MMYKEITECGMCKSKEFTTFLDLGFSPLANSLKDTPDQKEIEAPLEVVKCNNINCQCFQLKHLVDPEVLFSSYSYRSSKGLEKHFKEYARHTYKLLDLFPEDSMLGIGGNIGQLEKAYNELGLLAVNVEPAKNIAEESVKNGVYTVNSFFDKSILVSGLKHKYKLICANNVLAHCCLDPIIEGIKELLDKDGYLVMENAYWLNTIRDAKDIFQVYSEHYKYLSIKPLRNFFALHGFDLFRVEYNKIQGGTFRAYIKWKENTRFDIDKSVEEAVKNEEEFGLYKKEIYKNLLEELFQLKVDIYDILKEIVDKGQKIGLFSVAAKTTLMLKNLNMSEFISYSTDDSNLKWNKFVPGSDIKILSKDEFWAQKPDYVLVGAYNFFDDIVKNNRDRDCRWIRVLPKLEIV